MNKYPKNMLIEGNKVFFDSYHVATIKDNELIINTITDIPNRLLSAFYVIAVSKTIGEIFGKDNNEQNYWKLELLHDWFKNKGTIMPDDWKTKLLKSGFEIIS